jgi:triosephosphate isomerase
MNLPSEGFEAYRAALAGRKARTDQYEIVVAPPYPFLSRVADGGMSAGFTLAGQNCSHETAGAFTGEVSAQMLSMAGASYAIVGHSERRRMFGESNVLVGKKAAAAVLAGLKPIICIGEEWSVRDDDETEDFLAAELRGAWSAELANAGSVVVAYEPVWAVGTGRNASGEIIAETVSWIRKAIARHWKGVATEKISILYGGSVTPQNVSELWTDGDIDGFLVGGASLDSQRFLRLAEAMIADPQPRIRRS